MLNNASCLFSFLVLAFRFKAFAKDISNYASHPNIYAVSTTAKLVTTIDHEVIPISVDLSNDEVTIPKLDLLVAYFQLAGECGVVDVRALLFNSYSSSRVIIICCVVVSLFPYMRLLVKA